MQQNWSNQLTQEQSEESSQISRSIQTINELMEKINKTVLNTHNQQITETLMTETDDAELIQQLRVKLSRIKLPTHKIHIKNKLSTVIEESVCNSELVTPRDVFMDHQSPKKIDIVNDDHDEQFQMTKKITGIRKCSSLKNTMAKNSPIKINNERESNKKVKKKQPLHPKDKNTVINHQKHVKVQEISIFANKTKLQSSSNSKSKSKKGLSVYSKKSMQSEESELTECLSKNLNHKTQTDQCSEEKQKQVRKKNKKQKNIQPFVVAKQTSSTVLKENKIKTCLSRTNIRDFYTSKRVNV